MDRSITVLLLIGMMMTLGVLVVREFHPIYMLAVVIGIVSVFIYLLFRGRWANSASNVVHIPSSCGIVSASLLLLSALGVYAGRVEQYEKPLLFYVIMAVAVVFVFAVGLRVREGMMAWVLVGLASLVGLTHIWTEAMMFPDSLIGIDTWTHEWMTMNGLALAGTGGYAPLGLTTLGGSYSLMHLYLRGIITITGLSYQWASLLFVGSLQMVGSVVLVFLIGRKLWDVRVGVIGALLVAVAGWNIFFAEWIIPNGIGATLALLAGWLIIKMHEGRKRWLVLIIAALVLVAFSIHLLAAIWVLGTVGVLTLVVVDWKWRPMVMVGIAAIVVAWLQFTTMGGAIAPQVVGGLKPDSGLTYAVGLAPSVVNVGVAPGVNVVKEYLNGSLGELTIDSLGMLVFIGLGLTGMLIMLRRGRLQRGWVLLTMGALAVGFFPPLFRVSLLEHRWWYLAQVLGAVPLAVFLVAVSGLGRRVLPVVAVVVFLMAFLSTVGLPSNLTNRSLSPNLIVRYAFTEAELEAFAMAEHYSTGSIGMDSFYGAFGSSRIGRERIEMIDNAILKGDFRGIESSVIVLRDSLREEPFGSGGGTIYKLTFVPAARAEAQGWDIVWRNAGASVLVKRG